MPSDAFGPFRLLHQIGTGALGPVFRAYDSQRERLVAVKLFRLNLAPELVEQLAAGLQRLVDAKLIHPAVAAPIASGIVGTSAYLAQEFVAADSLDTVVREFGPVPPDEAARVALQLAGALDFAAAANVWHGALHPQDVFLASDEVRLTGLGIAQLVEQFKLPTTVRRPYAAPERVAGGQWDGRADVFGLAVLIAEMIGGRRLSGSGPRAVEEALLGSKGVDADSLRSVFARALADDPKQRFDTAVAFAEALKQAVHAPLGEAAAPRVGLPDSLTENRLPLADPIAFVPELTGSDDTVIIGNQVDRLSGLAPASSIPTPGLPGLPGLDVPEILPGVAQAGVHAHARGSGEDVKDLMREIDTLLLSPEQVSHAVKATETMTNETKAGRAPAPNRVGDGAARAAAALADAPLKRPAAPAQAAPRPIESRSQSAVWPLALALLVGLIVGIAVGFYVFADRARRNADAPTQADGSLTPDRPPASLSPNASSPSNASPPTALPPTAPGPSVSEPTRASSGGVAAPVKEAVPSSRNRSSASPQSPSVSQPIEHPTERPGGAGGTGIAGTDPHERFLPLSARQPAIVADISTAEIEAAGRVLVRSSPAGARVMLDGKEVGMTPVTVRALAFGTHIVRLTRDGYLDHERRVSVSAKRPAQSLIVELSSTRETRPDAGEDAAAPFTAALVVESRPAGAIVFLNGARVGTTPLTLDTVATGSQALWLEMDGYRRWTSSIRVIAGERNRVTASLEQ